MRNVFGKTEESVGKHKVIFGITFKTFKVIFGITFKPFQRCMQKHLHMGLGATHDSQRDSVTHAKAEHMQECLQNQALHSKVYQKEASPIYERFLLGTISPSYPF